MRRMIVHDEPDHRMGGEIYYREQDFMHDPELHRAFTCGVKQGWREAMEESERRGGYHERRDWREMPPMMREHNRGGVDYREEDWDDDYSERRYRNSMGRFARR